MAFKNNMTYEHIKSNNKQIYYENNYKIMRKNQKSIKRESDQKSNLSIKNKI